MFSTAPMDRLGSLGYPNDAEVDALINQLSDETLLKMKVNSHTTSSRGFEYPTFTDGWLDDDATEALDTQLTSRFSSLKRPITPAKKKGKDSLNVGKKGSNSDAGVGSKKVSSRDSQPVFGKKAGSRDSQPVFGKKASSRDSQPVFGEKSRDSSSSPLDSRESSDYDMRGRKYGEEGEESRRLSSNSFSRTSSRITSSRREDGSSTRQHPIKRESSRSFSQRTEFFSFRSSDDAAAAAAGDEEEDPDNIDALLNERFRALKAPSPPTRPPPPPPPISSAPSTRNLGLDNIIQISGQLSTSDYDNYGSSFSIPNSPSANLLGRSRSRSSPRFMTTSVATSCHCSAPSALKLLKQVGSKSFPSKQQPSTAGSLPPLSPAPRSTPHVKKPQREYKVEGFGNSKPGSKDSEKHIKEKKGRKEKKENEKVEKNERKGRNEEGTNNNSNDNNNNNPSTVKDVRRLLSSVADRVGLERGMERSRVSSAADDDFLGEEDLNVWSVIDGDQEFARASTEEEKLNREAERVVEWAKDAARLETGESDVYSDADELELDEADDAQDSDEGKPSKKGEPKKKGIKVAPKKKKWGLF